MLVSKSERKRAEKKTTMKGILLAGNIDGLHLFFLVFFLFPFLSEHCYTFNGKKVEIKLLSALASNRFKKMYRETTTNMHKCIIITYYEYLLYTTLHMVMALFKCFPYKIYICALYNNL